MKKRVFKNRIAALTVTAVLAFGALTGCGNKTDSKTNEGASDAVEITNVSYDPTRELYAAFAKWKCKPFRSAHYFAQIALMENNFFKARAVYWQGSKK